MIKKMIFFSILMGFSNVLFAQDYYIEIPSIEAPEYELLNWWEHDKIENPIFLNGTVQSVSKSETIYSILDQKTISIRSTSFELNKEKEVIKFASDIEFDDRNADYYNRQRAFTSQKDTIINQDGFIYYIVNGKLQSRTEVNSKISNSGIVTDSTVYSFSGDRLIFIKQFKREISILLGDLDDPEEETIYVSEDLELSSVRKAKYNSKGQLVSRELSTILEDQTEVFSTLYKYDSEDNLKSYKSTGLTYNAILNLEKPVQSSMIKEMEAESISQITLSGEFEYKNERVVEFVSQNSNGKIERNEISYSDNKRVIKTFRNNKLSQVAEISFDAEQNPILIKTSEFELGKEAYFETIQLNITYYK